uniref:Uncharacterized protein n=1 Tax=Candidatus Kentrum eta TaxID=2126337 RepID=A0A450VYQ2_9GAMM|nr:MAG: hypothetical protein BECKH772B_GA0070898_106292 [Candidatus Kentron sp. H]VFK06604.1 MAG: hypothetical protein BECKH772A_GA0070896_106552 [Candidatus Kentron sp. H]VFK09951.1 MAG: hypothetical protein BECKH772C_GA0070978_106622 [Candidatus Kentron sp. H]
MGDKHTEVLLQRLVDLNHQRAAVRIAGIHSLVAFRVSNPPYTAVTKTSEQVGLCISVAPGESTRPLPWPEILRNRSRLLRIAFDRCSEPAIVQ